MEWRNTSTAGKGKIISKNNKHAEIVSEKLQIFYENNEFFDTVLIVGNSSVNIQAHRVVLCALSEYFLEIFRGDQASKINEVKLSEIEPSTLKLIIDYMYSGSIELNAETVGCLLRTASFLKIKTLIEDCSEFIEKNINSSNSVNWFRLSYELNLPKLKAKSLKCIYNNFKVISKQKELLQLSENELKNLLFTDNPHGDFEEDVFLAMVKWINYDKLNREHLVFELLSMVRFQALTPKFIVENRKTVCKTVESYELICSWIQWHLSPETRSNDQQICTFEPRKVPDKIAFITHSEHSGIINILEKINENSWFSSKEIRLQRNRSYLSSTIIDDKLIVAGVRELDGMYKGVKCVDLKSLESNVLPSMKRLRQGCQLEYLKEYLCAFGGDNMKDRSTMELYSFSTDQWYEVQLRCMPSWHSQIAVHNGIAYILDSEKTLLQSYDVSSRECTLKSVGNLRVSEFGFAAVQNFLFVFGGLNNKREVVKTVKRYDLSNDSWCEVASMPTRGYKLKTVCLGNTIVIFNTIKSTAFEYNVDTDTFKELNVPSHYHVIDIVKM